MKTPYDVLGISLDADEKTIATAFREAACSLGQQTGSRVDEARISKVRPTPPKCKLNCPGRDVKAEASRNAAEKGNGLMRIWRTKVERRVTPANVLIEQDRGLWFVVRRKPHSRPRFLWSQLALYEAQRADQRGDIELAARLRCAAIEAKSRNASIEERN